MSSNTGTRILAVPLLWVKAFLLKFHLFAANFTFATRFNHVLTALQLPPSMHAVYYILKTHDYYDN